jgi:hypothetical protein
MRPSYRTLAVATIASLVLSIASIGLLAWVLADAPYWFPGACLKEKGPQGDQGPRGPIGEQGPPGPVEPDAESAIDDVSASLDDLSSSVDDLSGRLDDLETGGGDQASSSVDDVANTVSAICDELSGYGGALGDIYLAAC